MIYQFSRYVSGHLMAEGVTIERARSLQEAVAEAARIAPRGPNGEAPVLILREIAVPGLVDALTERYRQIEVEDFDASHDDMATKGQLATAAACYAFQAGARGRNFPNDPEPIGIWPWDREWSKPADPRRNLLKAAALIIAEIERIDRADARASTGGDHA